MAASRALRDVMRGEKGMVPKKGHSEQKQSTGSHKSAAPQLKQETRSNTRREVLNSSPR
jgi:hypothetical protein